MSAEGIGKALLYFREITARAPDFALGLAGHAGCLVALGWWGHVPGREVYPAAKEMTLKAFHAKLMREDTKLGKVAAKEAKGLPLVREVDALMIEENFERVKWEVREIVDAEMGRIAGDPALAGMVVKR